MAFDHEEASKLLAVCHRRCCICHRFCGVKMELDQIVPCPEYGSDDINNAIPVCFECHTEIQLYNDDHPRVQKYDPVELRFRKEQWLKICKKYPMQLIEISHAQTVTPILPLIDELEFNKFISKQIIAEDLNCLFEVRQFDQAIDAGVISMLAPGVRDALYGCYANLKSTNESIRLSVFADHLNQREEAFIHLQRRAETITEMRKDVIKAIQLIREAVNQMQEYLLPENDRRNEVKSQEVAVKLSDFILPEEGLDLRELENLMIRQALARVDGNQTQAAKLLGLTRDTFRYRLEKLGLL